METNNDLNKINNNENIKFINACFQEKLNTNILNTFLKSILERNRYEL